MASYFHGNPEIQGGGADGLQTLILMNPAYVGYSENQPQTPLPGSSGYALNFSHPTSALAGLPQDSQHHYNLYNPPIGIGVAREVTQSQQGLSLSLSSQQYTSFRPEREVSGGEVFRVSGGSPSSASGISNDVNGVLSVVLSSKYLKAAQEILDEVVNVGKGAKNAREDYGQPKNIGESSRAAGGVSGGDGKNGGEDIARSEDELTTSEKQEIQMKKAKLVGLLDEIEQSYKKYQEQMQIVISLFEQIAGTGSAKTYTALALETISKQFRCLKDAILGQIQVASKSLGEEDSSGGKIEGSKLKYIDNQIRHQRALQQLGMIQHNAWRPQRGLPEQSVSVLRAWLFEHFLHPYPKDSDKIMLAKQTGLTRSQVSNWFINARVRLWKPMVEEMYTEEMKEQEGNRSEEEVSASRSIAPQAKLSDQNKSFISKQDNPINQHIAPVTSISTSSKSPTGATMRNNANFNLIGSSETESISPRSIPSMNMESKPTNLNKKHIAMRFGNERQSTDRLTLMGAPTNFIGGFISYPNVELRRFGVEHFQAPCSGNGVSLTLGLPRCENLSMSGAHQTFLPNLSVQLGRGVEIREENDFSGMNTPTSTHSSNVYESINTQNRKRFAAELLPDFVT